MATQNAPTVTPPTIRDIPLANTIPGNFLLFAGMAQGKTTVVKYLIRKMLREKLICCAFVISSNHFEGEYAWLPQSWLKDTYDEGMITALIDHQKKIANNKRRQYLIVFDDMLAEIDWNSDFMTSLLISHRHLGISLMISAQYMTKIPLIFRDTCRHGVLFFPRSEQTIDNTHKIFGQSMKLADFKRFYRDNTDDARHQCLIYDNDRFYKFVAPVDDNTRVIIRQHTKKRR